MYNPQTDTTKKEPIILGIETSCDETAAAVICGRKILSDEIASSAEIQALYGGVVPEIASRAHTDAVACVVGNAVKKAGISYADIDAVAVDQNVAVRDDLTRLSPAAGETETINDVVETAFQDRHQDLPGVPLGDFGHPIIFAELLFEHSVESLDLLLFAKVNAVFGLLAALHAMHARRERPAVHGTMFAFAAGPFKHELNPFTTTFFTDSTRFSSHNEITPNRDILNVICFSFLRG